MTDQQQDATTYDAYVLRAQDGSWLAQLADLPGAYATGASQEEATARLSAAIPAYFAWLSQHDEYTPITHGGTVVAREVASASTGPTHGAFFSGDAEPVTEEDLDWWLAALDWEYGDLVAAAERGQQASRQALLGAVAVMQLDIVARATGAPVASSATSSDPAAALQAARQAALAAFRRTNADQRGAVREEAGERWSVRRGLRESALLVRRATDELARM